MNPFDEECEQRIVRNPFHDEDGSPIAKAVNAEVMRQAELLFSSAMSDDTPNAPPSDHTMAAMAAMSTIMNADICSSPSIPIVFVTPAASGSAIRRGDSHYISRSKTDASISKGQQIIRAASTKAVISRRASSRQVLIAPTETNRPASTRAISSRAGAIAAGDEDTIELVKSRSQHFIGNHIAKNYISPGGSPAASRPGSSRPGSTRPAGVSEAEYQERCEHIFDLIKRKFLKHIRCETCKPEHMCMCSQDCEASADVFSERYGRLGNKFRVKPGYYAMGHLVDVFIDAYDEEKRMETVEKMPKH